MSKSAQRDISQIRTPFNGDCAGRTSQWQHFWMQRAICDEAMINLQMQPEQTPAILIWK
jgi:hypothetical protein